jgi:hypothetical protein
MRIIIDTINEPFKLFEITDDHLKDDKLKNSHIKDKNRIVKYMKKSEYLSILLDCTKCIFTRENIEHFKTLLTDGKWIWSADIIYYIENHNYILPIDFLSDIRKNNYKTRKLTDEAYNFLHDKIYKEGFVNFDIMNKTDGSDMSTQR